jgi:hypothetical protein
MDKRQQIELPEKRTVSIYIKDGISVIVQPDGISLQLWSIFIENELGYLIDAWTVADISEPGNLVLSPGVDTGDKFFDLHTGKLLYILTPTLRASKFTADGKAVVLQGADGHVEIWGVPQP